MVGSFAALAEEITACKLSEEEEEEEKDDEEEGDKQGIQRKWQSVIWMNNNKKNNSDWEKCEEMCVPEVREINTERWRDEEASYTASSVSC